ncbi:MAG: TrkA C-terminal domain-containing protein [Alphaproteobacteria bacterium]|nr:TrkA C-terminal domain-containing protein [Alphaproteobacteria bacterium]
MEALGAFLDSQPFIALFLVIGLGYACGRISIAGFSLGIGAVLFVGLAVGAIAPKSGPPGLIGLIGLVLFLYGIGIQYGTAFFKGLVSPFGIKANILALLAVMAGFAAAIGTAEAMGFGIDFAAGIFAGSLTSTATLQAAIKSSGSNDPAVGYAIAYPFGVFGPILCFFLFNKIIQPKVEVPAPRRLVVAEARAGDRGFTGMTVADVLKQAADDSVDLLMVRRGDLNMIPEPALTLQADDILAVHGFPETLAELKLANTEQARADRRDLDYVRVFVSKPGLVGTKLNDLPDPEGFAARVITVRRGDIDLMPNPELVIEYGDQVGVLVETTARDKVRQFFGDSIKAESEFDFVSFGLGLAIGGMVGLIPIPIPGIGSVKLGLAGGPLVVSLVLGYYGRIGPFNWNMPVVANILLRNFGLTLFLAGVGMSSGAAFAANFGPAALTYFISGVVVLLAVVLFVLILGYYVLRMGFDECLGIASGSTGNPAILAYGNRLAPTGKPDVGYAMIFPGVGTILKIIAVQIMVAVGGSGGGGAPPS